MIETTTHKFKKPELNDFIVDTIQNLHDNFELLEGKVDEKTITLGTFLSEGVSYKRGKVVWNLLPVANGTVGWVNVREGRHASTWQERTTYSLGDLVSTQGNNGHVYECIENGVSGVTQPIFPVALNGSVFDFNGGLGWIGNHVYSVDDIALATNGNQLYYYRCILGGTSSPTEPVWVNTVGTQIDDGGAKWQVYKSVKWKEIGTSCEFREFGKIS